MEEEWSRGEEGSAGIALEEELVDADVVGGRGAEWRRGGSGACHRHRRGGGHV